MPLSAHSKYSNTDKEGTFYCPPSAIHLSPKRPLASGVAYSLPLIRSPLQTVVSLWSRLRQNSRKLRVLERHWMMQFIKHYKSKRTVSLLKW